MDHGFKRSLNVFQPTQPLHYNNGVCQYKRGAMSYLYILGTIFSLRDFLTLPTDHKIRGQCSAFIALYCEFISIQWRLVTSGPSY
jgi:hypothetical protein